MLAENMKNPVVKSYRSAVRMKTVLADMDDTTTQQMHYRLQKQGRDI